MPLEIFFFRRLHRSFFPLVLTAVSLASCGDDPVLVEKREKQQAEISRLKGELSLIDEKLKSLPPDVAGELEEAKKRFAEQTAEAGKLESEIAELEARKRALQAEFDAYRAKYSLN